MKKNRAAGETGVTPDVSHAHNMRVRVAHENNNNNNLTVEAESKKKSWLHVVTRVLTGRQP